MERFVGIDEYDVSEGLASLKYTPSGGTQRTLTVASKLHALTPGFTTYMGHANDVCRKSDENRKHAFLAELWTEMYVGEDLNGESEHELDCAWGIVKVVAPR